MAGKNDDLYDLDLENMDYEDEGSFSLESILSEYKGNAYIENERKTPGDILDVKADEIIRDVLAGKPLVDDDDYEVEGLNIDISDIIDDRDRPHREIKQPRYTPPREPEPPKDVSAASYVHAPLEPVPDETAKSVRNEPSFEEPKREYSDIISEEEPITENEAYETESFEEPSEPVSEEKPKKKLFSKIADYFSSSSVFDDDFDDSGKTEEAPVQNSAEASYIDDYQYASDDEDFNADEIKDPYREKISFVDKFRDFIHTKKVERDYDDDEYGDEFDDEDIEEEPEPYIPEEEPSYKEESRRFVNGLAGLAVREMIILAVGLLALLLNAVYAFGFPLPFGIGRSFYILTGILLIAQLIAMLCGVEIIIGGISDILSLTFSTQTFITFSAVITAADAFSIIMAKNAPHGLPYCVITIFAIYFAVLGRKSYRFAMADSFRSATEASANPQSVIIDDKTLEKRAIIKKITRMPEGFWRMSMRADGAEEIHDMLSPILFAAAIALAAFSAFSNKDFNMLLHSAASMVAAASSFAACIAFAVPFRIYTRRMRQSGAVIAGWGGIAELCGADGVLVTDSDVFPVGSVKLTSIKMLDKAQPNRLIGAAGSLAALSGSGLADVFGEFMRARGIGKLSVENFSYYEGGGLGGRIGGENMLFGTSAFMNLMGVSVPPSINERNALFLAVNRRVAMSFSLEYMPASSVRKGMLSLLRCKTSMLFAAKDGNITPHMLQKMFKVSMDGIEYISADDCYNMTTLTSNEDAETMGVIFRSGLMPLASMISGAKKIKSLTYLLSFVSAAASIVGLVCVFSLCFNAAFAVNTAINIIIYQFAVLLVAYLVILLTTRR